MSQHFNKEKLLKLEWRSFEKYPKHGAFIVLHIMGSVVRENTILHDFKSIRFNAFKFKPSDYIPKDRRTVVWKFSWLPLKEALI